MERTHTMQSRTLEQALPTSQSELCAIYSTSAAATHTEGPIRPMCGHCDLGGKRLTLEMDRPQRMCPSLNRLRFESSVNHRCAAVVTGRIGIEMQSQQLHRRQRRCTDKRDHAHARTRSSPPTTHTHTHTHSRTGNLTAVSSSLTTGRKRRNEQTFRTHRQT
jgi:hypothetical protein